MNKTIRMTPKERAEAALNIADIISFMGIKVR